MRIPKLPLMTEEMSAKSIILYADDDQDDLELIREVFSRSTKNVELVTAADGLEALSFLKSLDTNDVRLCLIILDINMPRMDGKETLIAIRKIERFKGTPTILFTTSVQPEDKEFAKKYHAGFITKPVEYRQIDVIANRFIEHCTDEMKKHLRRKGER